MAHVVKIDHAGARAILSSPELARAVHDLAEDLAADVRSQATIERHAAEVVVDDYTTDRVASSVTIAHPGGVAMQAKHGVLTRALPVPMKRRRK